MSAVALSPYGVVADHPSEHFAAARSRFWPLGRVLKDFVFEGCIERFGQRIVTALVRAAHIDEVTTIRRQIPENRKIVMRSMV